MRAAGRAGAALAGVLALAGCTGSVAVTQAAGTAEVSSGASCLDPGVLAELGLRLDPSLRTAAPEPTSRGLPPETFVADSVVVCDRGETLRDSAGRWWAVTTTHLEGDLDPLVTALGSTTPEPCGLGVVPQLWLVDALGAAVLLPRDTACDVTDLLATLEAVDRVEQPVALAQANDPAPAP